jgi:hypothetical protein
MKRFLNKPFRDTGTKKNRLVAIMAIGLFIFLFLFLFRPFGLQQFDTLMLLFFTLGFGLITSCVLFVFKFLFEPVVVGERWTIGKNILWDIVTVSSIGAANYFYIQIVFKNEFSLLYLLYSIWTALLVGIIPATISYFIIYNRMYRSIIKEAAIPEDKIFRDEEVTITAGYSSNNFRINAKQIIYLCSNDNYITIVTIKDDVLNKTTIRGTLKSAEYELRKISRFIRCHKCYIVNLDFVEKITGNNQNMKIRLRSSNMEIPVARSKAELVGKLGRKVSVHHKI